ncbi:MAG: M1 family metallopeptidase [Planctomycetes bacterium]|nr:M1 family metallopeptidase [Planctomycetota bacterium]
MRRTDRLTALLALTAAGTLAAQDRVRPYPVTEPAAWRRAVADGTRSASGAPGPRHWSDRVAYRIEAALEPATATVRGTLVATYENGSPEPTRVLWLHLRQNLHREGGVRNRSVAITGGMTVDDLRVDGEPVRARPRGTQLPIRLSEPLAPGATATVSMRFEFVCPPAGGAPRMGHENHHVFYLGYWYPQFAVRDDVDDWTCEPYLGNAEFYMPYGDYDVAFTAPAGWLVRATGSLLNASDVLTEGARAALERARTSREVQHVVTREDLANGTVTQTGADTLTWRFRAERVRDCAVSISDRYLWDATHADVPGRAEPAEIHAVYEASSSTWPRAAEIARATIEWMSREVYPYPWPHMTACEGVIGGGMEYPMMTIIGDSRSVRGLEGVVAHELIHMWFPMLVGTNEKAYAWMDEGTTSFFTDLCTAAMHGSANDRGAMLGYVRSATRVTESPMMTHGDYYPYGYEFASYTKPAALLHQLRALLRDGSRDVLLEALRTYVSEWAYDHPTPYDLWRTIERVADRDLDWYWQPWYCEVRTLDHAIGSVIESEDGVVVEIVDRGDVPYPCTVEARYGEGRSERRTIDVEHWLAGNRTATVTFPGGALAVQIDPDRDTLDVDPRNQSWTRDR